MIQSFDAIGGKVGGGKSEALAQGISLALVSTAFGLGIAVVSVAAYYYLLNRVDLLVRDLDDQVRQVIDLVSAESLRPAPTGGSTTSGPSRGSIDAAELAIRLAGRLRPGGVRPMLADRLQSDELPQINMTPMVDVVLCLLVFFMAATRLYDWDENEFTVKVPEVADAAPLTSAPDDLTLTILAPNKVALEDQTLDLDALTKALDRGPQALRRPGRDDPGRRQARLSGPRRRPLRLQRRRHPQRPAPRPAPRRVSR